MLPRLRLPITYRQNIRRLLALLLVVSLLIFGMPHSSADTFLHNKQALLTTSEAGETSQYAISFTLPEPSTYGSLRIEVCANDPLPGTACTPPGGFDLSGATLTSQTGPPGFAINAGSTANLMILGRVPAAAAAGSASYTLDNVVNPSSSGSYFIRLQTYASNDATGSVVFQGGIALLSSITIPITATIPPYLTFCTGVTITGLNCTNASGDYIDFGELSSTSTKSGTSQMLAFTNAQSGYNLSVTGTTMTSGNDEIKAITTGDVSRPGTAQFGINLTANSTPSVGLNPTGPGVANPIANYGTPNIYRFVSGDTLASTTAPDNVRQFTASYIVNVPSSQKPGIYVTTITYVCLATF